MALNVKTLLLMLLSVSLGLIFIVSGATKLMSMELFEYQFVEIGVAGWKTAPYFARFLIGLEFFIGILLVLNIAVKKFSAPLAIGILLFFSVYLIYFLIVYGNKGDCGCFGQALKMSPLAGLIKNIALLIVAFILLWQYDTTFWKKKITRILTPILAIISMCCAFFIYPINVFAHYQFDNNKTDYKVALDLMYDSTQTYKPTQELRNGKHIVAFFSLTCPHCKMAAKKLKIIHHRHPELPLYIALNGEPKDTAVFFNETEVQQIPHNLFLGPQSWLMVAGIQLPVIMYLENGIVKKKVNGINLDEDDALNWSQQTIR